MDKLEYDPFLLGFGLFSRAKMLVSGEGIYQLVQDDGGSLAGMENPPKPGVVVLRSTEFIKTTVE